MTAALSILVLTVMLAQAPQASQGSRSAPPPAQGLSSAKALYAAASYEEALDQLSAVNPSEDMDQVDTYRALCLMALGREIEAAKSLERLLDRNPFHSLTEAEVSPRLVTMFKDVRTRRLPTAARELYMRARDKYDERSFTGAADLLRELLTALGREDLEGQAGLADLKLLAEGFLRLTETEIARAGQDPAAPAATPPPAPMPAPTPVRSPEPPRNSGAGLALGGSPAPVIYSHEDRYVVGPVEVTRRVPNWNPPPTVKRGVYHGLVEVVISERGFVERVEVLVSIDPTYDPLLLEATKTWRFRAATLNGEPVKYRRSYEIILHPE